MDFIELIYTAIGGGVGYLVNNMINLWNDSIQRRRNLGEHIMNEIEKNADTYYLMQNHSSSLSTALNQYITYKRQIQYLQPGYGSSYSDYLEEQINATTKSALFCAGKLYRTMYNHFFIKGARYFLPDKWADEAIVNLHNNMMKYLHFDGNVLLKYIGQETEEQKFYDLLKDSESNDGLKDLYEQFLLYKKWLSTNDKEILNLVAYANSYSDLFEQQMYRLYNEWYKRGIWRKEIPKDPLNAQKKESFLSLNKLTRELIMQSFEERKKEENSSIINEVTDENAMDFYAHFNMGWKYFEKKSYDAAIEEYNKAKDLKPKNAMIYNNLGNAYAKNAMIYKDNDYEKERYFENAIAMYEASLKLEENSIVYSNFGLMWKYKGNQNEAVKCFEQAIEKDPLNSNFPNELGIIYYQDKQWDKAIKYYGKAITLSPTDHILYSNLAGAYVGLADQREHESNKFNNDAEKTSKFVDSYRETAVNLYEQAIKLTEEKDDKVSYYESKGKIYNKLKQWEDASDNFEQAWLLDGKKDNLAYEFGINALESGMYQKAISAFDGAIKIKPDNAEYHFELGNAYFHMNDDKNALDEFHKAQKLNSKLVTPAHKTTDSFDKMPDSEFVYKELEALIQGKIGQIQLHQEKYSEAEEGLFSALRYVPNDQNILHALEVIANFYENKGDVPSACRVYDQILQIVGRTYNTKKYREKMVQFFYGDKILELFPFATPIVMELADDVVPYVKGEEPTSLSTEVTKLVEDMRNRVLKKYGITIPGVRFRGGILPPRNYKVLLMDIPISQEILSWSSLRLFPGSSKDLDSLKISGIKTKNPQTGDDAYLIEQKDWESVKKGGLELWSYVEYAIHHLEGIIISNLSEFVGHFEVMGMVEKHAPHLVKHMQDVRTDLTVLTIIIKTLLKERVPVTDFKKIAEKSLDLKEKGLDLLAIVGEIRKDVREFLPGNNKSFSFYELGEDFEANIKQSITANEIQPVLAMKPEILEYALGLVKQKVGTQQSVVIVVKDTKSRPFVEQLIYEKFPSLSVLSREELLPELKGKIL